jgi:cytochrome c oxidase subunit 1
VAATAYPQVSPYGAAARGGLGAWLREWLGVVDHKRIGALYLMASALFLAPAGVEALLIRLQLFAPNARLVSAALFNQLFTMHGTTMIFFVATPMLIGFENLVMPLMIGARDVAFPRLNALSFWLFLAGGLFINTGWFLGGSPDAGWFAYTPISGRLYNPGEGIDWYTLGLQLAGAGTIMTAINFITTILGMRTRGMTLMRMPLFVWATLIMSVLILFAFPALTVNLFLLTFDRLVGTQFFNPSAGGAPLLWANLFWVFGHPEVYILVLPEFGIVSEIVPTFARKPLFGYVTMVGALVAIGFLSFMVWVHHMFTLGYGPWVNSIFALTSMLIAVPTGVKIFNWLGTMWGGDLHINTAMHYVMGLIVVFTIGGMSGVMLAMAPADLQYNDTYFVVAHFHYVIVGAVLFGLFAAWYYWFPLLTGRLMHDGLGRLAFWVQFVGFNVTFFPQHLLGLMGMPRRVFTYPAGLGLTFWNQVSTVGAMVLGAGIVLWLANVLWSARHGRPSGPDPWDARTLEWSVPSPPPAYNFATLPLVRGRDPLWVEKVYGDGRLRPAPDPERTSEGVRMPAPDATPALLALAMTVFAYSALYRLAWGMAAAAAVALVTLHRYMFNQERHEIVALAAAHEPPERDDLS